MSFVHNLEKTLTGKLGVRLEEWPVFIIGVLLLFIAILFMRGTAFFAFSLALFLAPVWLPFLFITGVYEMWYRYQRAVFLANRKTAVFEIKPPRNLVKTPLAMEAVLSAMHLTGSESTWWQRFLGGTRPFWSLELVSIEGQVHFYIWGPEGLRRLLESQIYAQYPGTQVIEVPDYTRMINVADDEWTIWGCDYKFTDKDPIPIKTYVDFGLDKVQKEPEQVDPLANLLEFMGTAGKGEQLWLQMVIRAHKGEKYHKIKADGKAYTWRDEAKELIEAMRRATRSPYTDPVTGVEMAGFPNPTKGEADKMGAMDRNVTKLGFDVGIRCVYLGRPDKFHGATIAHMIALFKPYSFEGWNGINSTNWMKKFDDYPWEIGVEKRKSRYRHELIEAYRRRQFFYEPFFEGGLTHEETMVMNSEALATLYHIPSASANTPGLARVPSATGEAPPNLPT
ncbi:MAG: hypothetical protein RLZZ26_485 [Candidatus Parcubacteria bacterium]|jgi:hypothetical protein